MMSEYPQNLVLIERGVQPRLSYLVKSHRDILDPQLMTDAAQLFTKAFVGRCVIFTQIRVRVKTAAADCGVRRQPLPPLTC